MTRTAFLFLSLALFAVAASAQVVPDEALNGIQDNSFLLEEAYNQTPGVVQHISVFLRETRGDAWAFAFTQEWPVAKTRHQLSYTIPLIGGSENGLGDIALHYRYQLLGSAETNLAIAPRLSLILPTADDDFGDSSTGIQIGLPISYVLAPRLITHTNLGHTWFTNGGGSEWNVGQSLIYAAAPRMHVMLEGTYTRADDANLFVLSPGLRFAFNLESGMQIVPGIAAPIGFGDDDSKAILLYLSFEK